MPISALLLQEIRILPTRAVFSQNYRRFANRQSFRASAAGAKKKNPMSSMKSQTSRRRVVHRDAMQKEAQVATLHLCVLHVWLLFPIPFLPGSPDLSILLLQINNLSLKIIIMFLRTPKDCSHVQGYRGSSVPHGQEVIFYLLLPWSIDPSPR